MQKRTEGPPRDGHNDRTERQGWPHRTCDKHGQRNMRSNPQICLHEQLNMIDALQHPYIPKLETTPTVLRMMLVA
eukprot:6039645-Pleurochrysis_carterae.AAC.1